MIKVLFVDDEPRVLRGLQRMLSNMECDWETSFAASGREALEILAKQAVDVVVSDMRMPEMDGAALLNEIMRQYPGIVRIALSGHSERELVLRSVQATHQYLSKPCDPDLLRSVITRACNLRRLLADPAIRSLASQMNRIPSAPHLYREMMLQLEDSDKSLRDMGTLVSQDMGMTAKILQIVNSAFFGLPQHVSNPIQAACLLGLDVLKALVLTAHIFSELKVDDAESMALAPLWDHSTTTGAIARNLASAENCDQEMCDHALMAGLLHDTGRLILAVNMPDRYREMLSLSANEAMPPLEAERQVFGTTHAEVGAYLLGLWGLPDPTVEAVAFHHHPAECVTTGFAPVTAVHVADAIEHAQHENGDTTGMKRLDTRYLESLGLAQRLSVWQDLCLAGANR